MLEKVVSGGQTGVDIAGLEAAKNAGLQTGGWMPKGFRTDVGNKPAYKTEYGMKATSDREYATRTQMNVFGSDATLLIAIDFRSRGTALTATRVREYDKKSLQVQVDLKNANPDVLEAKASEIADWIRKNAITTLNVAGNKESTAPGIHDWALKVLSRTFELLRQRTVG